MFFLFSDEFYQLGNPHRDSSEGFGLGLSIVKRLVELLEIEMKMESWPDQGTQFTLTLPDSVAGRETGAPESAHPFNLDGLRVLTVDDEIGVREGMETLLSGFGCRVGLAEGTPDALQAARKHRPDIMLVDFRLRNGDDGLSTIRGIRDIYPDLSAVLISGDTAPERLRQASDAGIELLHKPVFAGQLIAVISEACGKGV